MKKLILATLGLFALATAAKGDETKYTLEMTGVTWAGCKTYVRGALEKTFKATSIVITAGDKRGSQKVTFKAKDKSISKRDATDAMGDKKRRFIVLRIKKEKDSTAPDEKGEWHLLLLKDQVPYIRA